MATQTNRNILKITNITVNPYRLPMRQPWRSSTSFITERYGWIIELTSANGYTGRGDCAPLPDAGTETFDMAKTIVETALHELIGLSSPITPVLTSTTKHLLNAICSHYPPSVRCGVETALVDLAAQSAGIPLAKWLSATAKLSVPVNAALGAVDANLSERVHSAIGAGYRVLKIKVGLQSWEIEKQYLQACIETLPDGVKLRLDANQAWSEPMARIALRDLTNMPIESVEEPVAGANFNTLAELQNCTPFPLALDESLATIPAETVLNASPVRRLVLKPTVLGGLIRTLAIAERAHGLGLECVVTSTLESSVGINAIANLAATLNHNLAHGLATSDWFIHDTMAPHIIEQGYMLINNHLGLKI